MTKATNPLISNMKYEKKAAAFPDLRLDRERALKPEIAESHVNRTKNSSLDKYQYGYRCR
ncbi:MAG: hypothetical protein PVG78_08815 [Desulfobacterales bacterium]|jgi:hypothetical protein